MLDDFYCQIIQDMPVATLECLHGLGEIGLVLENDRGNFMTS